MPARPISILLIPSALYAQVELLQPLLVLGEVARQSGVSSWIGPDEIAEIPTASGTYQDLFALTAGAYSGNPNIGTFSLRGINQDDLFGYIGTDSNPLINVLQDGAPLSPSTLRYLPPVLWDLESAEILRGPQIASGPNSMGGALLLEGRTPEFSSQGHALAELTESNGQRLGLAQDFTLRPEELAIRGSYYHQQSDGYETNRFDNDDEFGATERDEFKALLRWHPGKNPDAIIDLDLTHDTASGNPIANSIQAPDGDLYDRTTSLNTRPFYEMERLAATLNANAILPNGWKLSSTTSLQQLNIDSTFDLDLSSALDWFSDYFKDELRITETFTLAETEGKFQWLLGAYLERGQYDVGYDGVGLTPYPSGSNYSSRAKETANIAAIYGGYDWEFAERIHFSGALRLNHEDRELSADSTFASSANKSQSATHDTELIPQVALTWKPELEQSYGLQLARGYRGGGISYTPTIGLTESYAPEHSWEAELFARRAITRSWYLSTAIFHSWIEDQQLPEPVTGGFPGIDTLIRNAASATRYGAELESKWEASETLSFRGSLAFTKTEFRELTLGGTDRAGLSFPNAPEWTAALGINYRHPSQWFASTIFSLADSTYSYATQPDSTALESRKLLSARIGYAWEKSSIYLFGSNLLNDEFALSRADNRSIGLPIVGKATPPRCFGIGYELRW
jgi:outer membrane receptor protein involved in Fe transport